jgi:hypothetical protein
MLNVGLTLLLLSGQEAKLLVRWSSRLGTSVGGPTELPGISL